MTEEQQRLNEMPKPFTTESDRTQPKGRQYDGYKSYITCSNFSQGEY